MKIEIGGYDMADGEARVCHQCFEDDVLQREIQRKGFKDKCSYCNETLFTLSLGEIADFFGSTIQAHYEKTPSDPSDTEHAMLWEGLMDSWYPDGQPVVDLIQEIGGASEEIAGDIRSLLEDRHSTREDHEIGCATDFDSDSRYEVRAVPRGQLDEEWPRFQYALKTKSRYIGVAALRTLDKIFEGITAHRTYWGNPLIVQAGPDTALTTLFRARVFQSDEALLAALQRPEISIGPPPHRAATAGRMNAEGIPVFYGATERNVAMAEVRPPVGCKVVVAQFEIIRPLNLLDVEALRSLSADGSVFDPQYLLHKQKAAFLKGLSEEISKPVMPDDETFNYIPTQVIAEYLASLDKPPLDGMIYRSVQAGKDARNVVLFNKASAVSKIRRREQISFTVTDYECYEGGPEVEYTVTEEFDSEYVAPKSEEPTPEQTMAEMNTVIDDHEPALQLTEPNVWVYHIKQVAITGEHYTVKRTTQDKKALRKSEMNQRAHPIMPLLPETP